MEIVFVYAGQEYVLQFEDERKTRGEISEQTEETIASETEELKSH